MRFVFSFIVVGAVLTNSSSGLADTKIAPESVWDNDIEQLYQTDVELPEWLSDSAEQENSPDDSEILVIKGLSGSAATSSAMSIAIREHLLPEIKKSLGHHRWSQRDSDVAEQRAELWLREGRIIERFEQPFYKDIDGEQYPAFTREAIKIDYSKQGLRELKDSVFQSMRKIDRLRKGIVWGASGITGAVLFLCILVYIVLDRLTRGFYAVRFRLMTSAVFLMSAGLIFYVARAMLNAV